MQKYKCSYKPKSQSHDIKICKDGSVTEDQPGRGFSVKEGRKIHEDALANKVTTSSLTTQR